MDIEKINITSSLILRYKKEIKELEELTADDSISLNKSVCSLDFGIVKEVSGFL